MSFLNATISITVKYLFLLIFNLVRLHFESIYSLSKSTRLKRPMIYFYM